MAKIRGLMSWQPYLQAARLHKPIPIFLMFFPCLWGIIIASGSNKILDLKYILQQAILFFILCTIARTAGVIYNDLIDKDFDIKVERTKNRPFASKKLSVSQGIVFLITIASIGLCLLLQLRYKAIVTLIPGALLAIIYPFAKRFVKWPQIVLALAFNWGIFVAFIQSDVSNIHDVRLWPHWHLYGWYLLACIWTLIYDSVYALQDIQDDCRLKLHSIPVNLGVDNTYNLLWWLTTFQLQLLLYLAPQRYEAILCVTLLSILNLLSIDYRHPKSCQQFFERNFWIGAMLSLICFLGYL